MNKLNNKGQTLVMFALIIPIFILIFTLVYDIGNLVYEKNKINNINYIVSKYVMDNYNSVDINNIKELIEKNDKEISFVNIDKSDNCFNIDIEKNVNGVFNIKKINIYSSYIIKEDRIERIK